MVVTLFDEAGRPVQTLEGDLNLVVLPTVRATGLRYVEGAYGQDHYLVGGKVEKRPTMESVKLQGNRLTGLPYDTLITINGQVYECGSDHAELEFDQPGVYQICVSRWPYLDWEGSYENPTQ
ncbi:hypothetical protein ACMHYO_16265 [Allopusillimonas ginsengisoli]|uniref:hypothetical protein n=1 Tax=Allopusillimonas ginsengisoli TaxID=453575 RepID=UPI0039C02E89